MIPHGIVLAILIMLDTLERLSLLVLVITRNDIELLCRGE